MDELLRDRDSAVNLDSRVGNSPTDPESEDSSDLAGREWITLEKLHNKDVCMM